LDGLRASIKIRVSEGKIVAMRAYKAVAVLAAVALFGAGCSGSGSGSSNSSGNGSSSGAKLTFWNGFTASDRQFVEQIVKNYNAKSSNKVDMTIEPWDTIYQKLQTSLPTGQGPDMPALDPSLVAQYASSGLIQPLDDLYGNGGIDKSIVPKAFFDVASYNGHVYAAPMTVATVMLYYNKKMFKEAGIASPPKTMDEMLQDAIKLTKNGPNGKQYGLVLADNAVPQWWSIFAWAYGGNLVSPDGKTSMLTDPNTIKGFQAWADAQKTGKISPVGTAGAAGDQLFQTQKAAMLLNGPWVTAGFTDAKVPYDVVPVPVGPVGQSRTLAVGATITVAKATKNKAAAEDFIKYWFSPESQLIYAGGAGSSPARTDMAAQLGKLKNPYPAKFAAVLPTAQYYLAGLKNYSQVDTDVITPAVQKILRGADVTSTLKEADGKLNALLKQQ
jgi:multiple sugar transport system substrate-binding protein